MCFIIWMTGFPCSGKSTLAKKLLEYIPKMEILDGDELNNWLTDGWTKESRIVSKNLRNISNKMDELKISPSKVSKFGVKKGRARFGFRMFLFAKTLAMTSDVRNAFLTELTVF